ncbi:FMN-linked oxidoreductase [Hyaloscypha variabilis F]|uniref:FMN-linked oxidoreductase n=1 Tax=Hyaloscypha variabilis (strain UAMH 11265 / GT02V1 / F) TaxID=1149755 RepID=A0A2J6QZV4_HYAVF|nr:FMN-linked oxidoreductase [Hyaloscypha variabilis F]
MASSPSPPRGAASALFTPFKIANGTTTLAHRIIMAPMTRNRGIPFPSPSSTTPTRIWLPDSLLANYYSQRSTPNGLQITENILISPSAGAMPGVPGLWLPEQVSGWKEVTSAVHAKGGIIYAQLCHHGRAALPQFTGLPTVSASATPWSTDEKYPYPPPGESSRVQLRDFPPKELSEQEIQSTIQEFVTAARNAREAGFDGVEVHAGNGYLLEQFLASGVNKRKDKYGGSAENRSRFVVEVVDAVGSAIGVQNMAVRMSPWGVYNDIEDGDRFNTWRTLCEGLGKLGGLSYVHFVEAREDERAGWEKSWGEGRDVGFGWVREVLGGVPVLSAGVWDKDTVWGAVESGRVDGCVFARWFVSNPDLVERLRLEKDLTIYNRAKFYGPTSKREVGYTDYLTWEEESSEK